MVERVLTQQAPQIVAIVNHRCSLFFCSSDTITQQYIVESALTKETSTPQRSSSFGGQLIRFSKRYCFIEGPLVVLLALKTCGSPSPESGATSMAVHKPACSQRITLGQIATEGVVQQTLRSYARPKASTSFMFRHHKTRT